MIYVKFLWIQVRVKQKLTPQQVKMAQQLIDKLCLEEMPHFENPDLQKHYASIQESDILEFL